MANQCNTSVEEQYRIFSQQYTTQCANKKLVKIAKECKQVIHCQDIVYCCLVVDHDYIITSHPHTTSIHVYHINGDLRCSIDIGMSEVWEMVCSADNLIVCASSDSRCMKVVNWKTAEIVNTITHTAGVSVGGHKTMVCFGIQKQYIMGRY